MNHPNEHAPPEIPETRLPTDADPQVSPTLLLQEDSNPSPPTRLPTPAEAAAERDAFLEGIFPSIPGYEVLGELGRGGMGVVYKARQVSAHRLVALKMILAGHLAGRSDIQRFQAEAEAVAQLDHPYIVPIYEVGEHAGMHFFSMKLVEGENLARWLKTNLAAVQAKPAGRRGLCIAAVQILAKVAHAVHHAHLRGILHRDLKPGNILLGYRPDTPGGEKPNVDPYVTDFGLAKRVQIPESERVTEDFVPAPLTQTGAVMGTPSYMSPEQARGEKDVTTVTDVYSLGAILYECLTGRPPFTSGNVFEVVRQVVEVEPQTPRSLNASLDRDLETVCLKCLDKDSAKRYRSAEALAEDLERWLRGEAIQARRVGQAERILRWCRRNPVVAGLLAATAAAVVFGFVMLSISLAHARRAEAEARRAEQEIQKRLAESYANAARVAAQRGQWRIALDDYDAALSNGHPDSVGLGLDRVKALHALHEEDAALREITALAGRPDLGDHAGAVRLWHALVILADDPTKALALTREAAAQPLSKADRAFAQAVLAETPPAAFGHLQEALKHEPYHHPANVMLGMMLVFLGRRDEARSQIAAAEKLFPNDPTLAVERALLIALEDELSAAYTELDKTRGQFGEEPMTALRVMLGVVHLLGHLDETTTNPNRFNQRIVQFTFALVQAALATKRTPELLAGNHEQVFAAAFRTLSLPPALAASQARILQLTFAVLKGQGNGTPAELDRQIEEIGAVLKVHPDGLLQYLYGGLIVLRVKDDDTSPRWLEAEQAFLAAARSRSIGQVRLTALEQAVVVEARLAGPNMNEVDPQLRKRFTDSLRELLTLGPLSPDRTDFLARSAGSLLDRELARRMLAESEQGWPNDVRAARQRARFELHYGAPSLAIEAAQRALKLRPDDAESKQLHFQALEKLRQQTDSLLGKP